MTPADLGIAAAIADERARKRDDYFPIYNETTLIQAINKAWAAGDITALDRMVPVVEGWCGNHDHLLLLIDNVIEALLA